MSFSFVGNERVLSSVDKFIRAAHIPHAIIIEGDEGTGRLTLARYIAKAAVCRDEDKKPCDNCRCCQMFEGDNHPDVIYITTEEKKKNISVAQIRALRADAYIKPHMQGKKVFIIKKADTMNEQSQNALLKVLEEPPENVVFILITESLAAFLDTIISRCVCLSLVPPEISDGIAFIKKMTGGNEKEIENALISTRGNIGKALRLLGRDSSAANALSEEFAQALFGNANALTLLRLVHPIEKDRVAAGEFIAQLKLIIADKIRENTLNPAILPRLMKMYNTVEEMQPHLITNINLSLFFTALVSRLK